MRILIAAGGTVGHVAPALAVADELRARGAEVSFAGTPQRIEAERSKGVAGKMFRSPVVTEIVALTKFYPAEDYHQDFFRKNPRQPYCQAVIVPKLLKLKKTGAVGE